MQGGGEEGVYSAAFILSRYPPSTSLSLSLLSWCVVWEPFPTLSLSFSLNRRRLSYPPLLYFLHIPSLSLSFHLIVYSYLLPFSDDEMKRKTEVSFEERKAKAIEDFYRKVREILSQI